MFFCALILPSQTNKHICNIFLETNKQKMHTKKHEDMLKIKHYGNSKITRSFLSFFYAVAAACFLMLAFFSNINIFFYALFLWIKRYFFYAELT